jgi:hypothetical protein
MPLFIPRRSARHSGGTAPAGPRDKAVLLLGFAAALEIGDLTFASEGLVVLVPLLTVSVPGLLDAAAASGELGPVLQCAVFYALLGIITALAVMGYAVWRPIAVLTTRAPDAES